MAMERRPRHCHEEFHVRVVGKVRHHRQHGDESLVSCITSDKHGGGSPASCGTGGKHAAASMPWRWAHGEGARVVALIEANDDGGNRRDKMALAAVCVLHRRRQQSLASREK
ncbi:hypothetical protein CFC21_040074 [Triticum aestivum]|uniref:Uncharacterized protein n=2 Tax=Triticum aestivum TaxID=4565 RepID=A0A9R1FFG8_WHEAT|nr:hypothetical protein CFC21_040074 [Triticum aestivum]